MTGELSTASSLRNTWEVPGTGNVTVTKKNPTALLIVKTSCRYIMECYLAINKNEVLSFATTWMMDWEGIIKSSKSDRKTNTVCYHLYVESKKQKLVNTTEKKHMHRYREQMSNCQWREGRGRGKTEGGD